MDEKFINLISNIKDIKNFIKLERHVLHDMFLLMYIIHTLVLSLVHMYFENINGLAQRSACMSPNQESGQAILFALETYAPLG